jgi:carbon storage regulator
MLVLQRRVGDAVVINDDIIVVVLGVRGKSVRLGFEAPPQTVFRRRELLDRADLSSDGGIASRETAESSATRDAEDRVFLPPAREVLDMASEEVERAGGKVYDRSEKGNRLFLRALFPMLDEVQPKDFVQGGVAVMATGRDIDVRHYVLRQVCSNGALMPRETRSSRIRRVPLDAPNEAIANVASQLRAAIRWYSNTALFSEAARKIAATTASNANHARRLLDHMPQLPREHATRVRNEVLRRFAAGSDSSLFGLMNAVTSVARDEPDPVIRWRLEELGGAIPSLVAPAAKPSGAAAGLVGAA